MNRVIKKICDKKGISLVELIISFALFSMFMAMAAMLLTNYIEVFSRINGMALGRSVSDMIMDTIDGQLSKATPNNLTEAEGAGSVYIVITEDEVDGKRHDSIKFYNDKGYETKIFLGNGTKDTEQDEKFDITKNLLEIRYKISPNADEDPTYSYWYYDDDVYMGNEISALEISRLSDAQKNIFKINLTVRNKKTGYEYSSSRIVECHNLVNFTDEYVEIETVNP